MEKPPVLKPTIPPLVVVILDASLMIAGTRMPEWLLGVILGAAILWLGLASVSVRENVVRRWPRTREWFPFLDPSGRAAMHAELSGPHIVGIGHFISPLLLTAGESCERPLMIV